MGTAPLCRYPFLHRQHPRGHLLAGLYHQVEEGSISLKERVRLSLKQNLPGSGEIKGMASGLWLTFRDLSMPMLIVSDNTTKDIIYNRVGRDTLHKKLRSLGLAKTQIPMNCTDLIINTAGIYPRDEPIHWEEARKRLRKWDQLLDAEGFREDTDNVSTPAQICSLLEVIERSQVVSSASGDEKPDILSWKQHVEMRLRQLLSDTIVAHYRGGNYGVLCDVGIVSPPNNPYIVAIMAKQATELVKVPPTILTLSRATSNQFVN